jgi:hypothetical protein
MVRERAVASGFIVWAALVLGVLSGAACTVGPGEDDDAETLGTAHDELGGCGQCENCVLYARCRQPGLPRGLFSLDDKLSIVNAQDPAAGCVAVIDTGSSVGHVAYVTGVDGDRVSIDEGNWGRRCFQRAGTMTELQIRGFWCPG